MALSSPMKLTSSASFSPSIRISLRLKIHQAQAKNFCRVLDIRVPEIVEADMPQTFQFQQLAEIAAEIPGIKNVPHYIHEHIAVVFPVVAVAADPLVFLLLLLQGQQLLPDIVDQRKRAQTGFRLGAILADDLILAVYLGICYDVSDGDGIALKVDGVPSQAQRASLRRSP